MSASGHHDAKGAVRVAVLTVSSTRRRDDDESGDAVVRALEAGGHEVAGRDWVEDEVVPIQATALELLDAADALVVTGGTGLAPRDVTPEAFAMIFERPWPAFGEGFRLLSRDQVGEKAWLSRATAGLVRRDEGLKPAFLLPGAPQAAALGTERLVVPLLAHVVGMLHEKPG